MLVAAALLPVWLAALAARGPRTLPQLPDSQDPAAVADAPPAGEGAPAHGQEAETAEAPPPYEPRYRSLEDLDLLLTAWIESSGGLATRLRVGELRDGRDVPALQLAHPSELDARQRPTVLLLGGLDGVSLAGGEAVLDTLAELLARPDELLPRETVVIAVPWAAPEALERTRTAPLSDGRNLRPVDEDADGVADEDGPDDLDGDGLVLHLLIEDPDGPWTKDADPRFLARARAGDAPRYRLTLEGRDDDGDGRFNEDGPGGVVLLRNFPSGRARIDPARLEGRLPLSEPIARALADLALERNTTTVLLFQGDHGRIGVPRVVFEERVEESHGDRASFELLGRAFAEATGRDPGAALVLRSGPLDTGSAVDWFYTALGALCVEVAPWGPMVGVQVGPGPATARDGALPASPRSCPLEQDPAWSLWLDNPRGGLGFSDWYPVELGGGRRGWIGGWQPYTRRNPPEGELPAVVAGCSEFVAEVLRGQPRIEARLLGSPREGELVHLRLAVRNAGSLPTGLWPTGRWRQDSACGVEVRFELPDAAQTVAGERAACLGRLGPGVAAGGVEWLGLLAPEEPIAIVVRAPWCAPQRLEVIP